jgi:trk system potassium uptake protein
MKSRIARGVSAGMCEIDNLRRCEVYVPSLKHLSPSLYPVLSFALLILCGTVVLLALPMKNGANLEAIDALFLVTSATCVTGLSVIDIGSQLTVWGQLTLLSCIQFGGLGIMTFSTVLILALGRSISFRSRFVVQDVFAHSPQADLHVLLRRVILFTFSFEAAGAFLLFLRFKNELGISDALYYGIFHSISAFCNAGFGLFADSLMRYHDDFLVNLTIIGLIVFGGIGFMVLHEVVRNVEKKPSRRHYWNQLSLHSKLVLSMTLVLITGGTLFFLVCEWSNTLNGFSLPVKLLASLFQSVTPRTAGFNTLDYGAMNNITLLGTVMLMFVGASPGSTGGGIKTTTMAVLLALSRARLSGSEDHVHVFKRSISASSVNRAFGIFVISVMIVLLGTAALLISETSDITQQASRGQLLELLFETTSAFGTVGLSMGITPKLSAWGKFILVLIMFTGRLGPLVIAMAIHPGRTRGKFYYSEERIMIG